jgi:hypothetical protein
MIKLSGFKKVLPWVSVALGSIGLILFAILIFNKITMKPGCFMCTPRILFGIIGIIGILLIFRFITVFTHPLLV